MSNSVTVRRLFAGDESIACAAMNTIRLEGEGESYRVDVDYMRKFLSMESNYLVVAYEGETPLGYVLGYRLPRFDRDRSMLYIHDVAVAANRRREGIGRMLINMTSKLCREDGLVKMFLITGKKNMPAMKLYLGTGGEPTTSDDPPEVFFWGFEGE